jgi:DNA-binding MarR family transcriptional regulator
MEKTVGYWLQRAARQHRLRTAQAVQDLGLFPGQEQLLVLLAKGEVRTVGDIAEMLRVRPPTVSKTLQRLAAQKLVERGENGDDARKSAISLTREGARRAGELAARMEAVERGLLDELDGKEARRLRKLLRKVAKTLARDRTEEAEPDPEDDEQD